MNTDSAKRETLNLSKFPRLDYSTMTTKTPISSMPKLHEINNANFARSPVRPFVEKSRNPFDRILDYVMGESVNDR